MATTGLLGLAESYQRTARRIGPLLGHKALDEDLQLFVRSHGELQSQNRHFWQAYRSVGLALAFFLAGILGISILLGKSSFFLYMAGLSAGIAVLGVAGAIWGLQGLRAARQCQKKAEKDADLLDAQPDYSEEEPPHSTTAPAKIRSTSSRKRTSSHIRALDRRRLASNR
jgi:hypothetical protein